MDSYESALRDVFLCMHLHHWRINILVFVCLFIKDYHYIHRYPFTAHIKRPELQEFLRVSFEGCFPLHTFTSLANKYPCISVSFHKRLYTPIPRYRPCIKKRELQGFLRVSFEGCFREAKTNKRRCGSPSGCCF